MASTSLMERRRDSISPAPVSRPRPPGSRRSSVKQDNAESRSHEAVGPANLLPSPVVADDEHESRANEIKIVRDLDLDLPSDLTAALESSMQRWPKRRHASERLLSVADENAVLDKQRTQSLSVGRKQGERLSKERLSEGNATDSPARPVLGELHQAHVSTNEPDENMEFDESQEASGDVTVTHHKSTNSIDSTLGGSDTSFDAAWVGGLPREELEQLLFESRQIIKERERDLGIAATIGKALLEKNISLRARHEGIKSRFPSMNSMERLLTNEEINTPLPRYSPPHADHDVSVVAGTANTIVGGENDEDDDDEQITPRPDGDAMRSGSSYFESLQASPTAIRLARIVGDNIDEQYPETLKRRNSSHYVNSTPASPAHHSNHGLPISETHRRLEMISQQNDELLDQIAQLQGESEKAKREGGRHQKKLIREIDGLRAELDAAQARNTELERKAEAQKGQLDDEKVKKDRPKRKTWRRRGTLPWKAVGDDEKLADRTWSSSTPVDPLNETPPATMDASEEDELNSVDAQSESGFSTTSRHRPQSEAERMIVVQLMSKVRELEDINSNLIRDAHERDGRIGRFMEDSERLRDMYDAVESEAVGTLSAASSSHDISLASITTPITSAAASPVSARRRRAPGNRYLIEGRRTLRAAMRGDGITGSSSVMSSAQSSANSSPTQSRPAARRLSRPRILITPSCEDLLAQSEADKAGGWENMTGRAPRSIGSELSLNDRYANEGQLQGSRTIYRRSSENNLGSTSSLLSLHDATRSLGSELGNAFDFDQPDEEQEEQRIAQRNDTSASSSTLPRSVRKTVSQASLGGVSEAASDIADLCWSTSTTSLRSQHDLPEMQATRLSSLGSPPKHLTIVRAQPSLSTLPELVDSGSWHGEAMQNILPRGALKNEVETSHENYSLLEKLTSNLPVHWADDEDFGKPITEREARSLGLLEGPPSSSLSRVNRRAHGVLSWIAPRAMQRSNAAQREKDRANAFTSSSKRQIESVEDVARRHELERLLRARRAAALQDRVVSGQLSADEAREKGAFDEQDGFEQYDGLANYSFEAEVTQRAFAYRSMRRQQKESKHAYGEANYESPSRAERPFGPRGSPHNGKTALSRRFRKAGSNEREGGHTHESCEPEENGGKGKGRSVRKDADNYPMTLRERYRPSDVQQKINRFSSETITLALAWATFSLVMVLAFVSAFARGPKRLLYGQPQA